MIDDALMVEFGHNRFVQLRFTPGVFRLRRVHIQPDFNNLLRKLWFRYRSPLNKRSDCSLRLNRLLAFSFLSPFEEKNGERARLTGDKIDGQGDEYDRYEVGAIEISQVRNAMNEHSRRTQCGPVF
ncbi:hypothetical protein CEXT_295381 [Caerostris extrusa]|uniref:Uncharacterized protein n=1 Tax=Caerostris extrusa TaxID=172846 RepID=A0AAV4SPQ4_CAEEX|nr:hypothetical protein CEXT_295381 [Caerostris extrusa]